MTSNRATIARRLFRMACVLWALLIPFAQVVRLRYLAPAWRDATWEISLGALALLWTTVTVWSGELHLGYRGIKSRTVHRSQTPAEFWGHVAIGAICGTALVGLGVYRLLHPA